MLCTQYLDNERKQDDVVSVYMLLLQDVIQFGALAQTLGSQVVSNPGVVPEIFSHVGILALLDWMQHFIALGAYTALDKVSGPVKNWANRLNPKAQYKARRTLESWRFGSGSDFKL